MRQRREPAPVVLRSDLPITECEAALRRATTGIVVGYLLAMLGPEDFRFGGRVRGGHLRIAWLTRWSRGFRAILAADLESDGEGTVLRGGFTWNKPAGIALALLLLAFVVLPVVQGVTALPVLLVPATVVAVSVHLRGADGLRLMTALAEVAGFRPADPARTPDR